MTRPRVEVCSSSPSDASFQRSLALLEQERVSDALAVLGEAVAAHPSDVRLFALRASCFERLGRLDEALFDHQMAVRLLPASPPARLALAECLRQLGRAEEAQRTIEHLLGTVGEQYTPALVALGELMLESDHLERAVEIFQKAAKCGKEIDPPAALSGLAQSLLRLERLDECEQVLRKLLKTSPDDARDWSALGNVLYQKERYQEAVDAFARAVEIGGDTQYHIQRAAALLQLRKPDEALVDLNYVAQEDPNGEGMHITHLMLGLAHYAKTDLTNAAKHFEEWLRNPNQNEEDPHQVHSILLKLAECTTDEKKAAAILQKANSVKQKQ